MFDPGLRTRVVYDIAVRYSGPLWPLGAVIRACCVCGLWLLLIWFPASALPFAPLFLALVTVGVCMAWLHTRGRVLDRLAAAPVPGLRQAARHLGSTQGRATADLSGVAESAGIVIAILLFTVAARPLAGWVYLTGVGLAAVYVWSAWSQAMTDASWYNPDVRPHPTLVRIRPLMPVAVALIAFFCYGWREVARDGSPPGGLAVVLLLAGSVLLLIPYTLLFELLLRSADETATVQLEEQRDGDSSLIHSLVKNVAHALIWQAREDPGIGAETSALINMVLAGAEEARLLIHGRDALGRELKPYSVRLLWDSLSTTVPGKLRDNVSIDQASLEVQMQKTDYGLARRVMSDLITNAWKAGSASIQVAVSTPPEDDGWINVTVADDGAGIPPGALVNPRTSLNVLQHYLQRFGGLIEFAPGATGGTLASARWRSLTT